MKTKLLLLCAIIGLLLSQALYAQPKIVTGTVVDATTQETLPGVNVVIKNTTTGTVTDASGRYSITVSPGQVLQFTSVGFLTIEVIVGPSNTIDVSLNTDIQLIDEVVVVGYGTQRKANLTGSVSTVDVSKTLEARPVADIGRGLQGTMPGLTIVVPSGEIGSDAVMKIRGQIGSLQGGSQPLILVDNVEVPSLQMLNPEDIESISVLKDAASSSIYGSKAAFGVILISTKKGAKTQGLNVSYNGNLSFQNISKKMEMGGIDAMEYTMLAFERVGGTVAGAFWLVTREGFERAQQWQQNWASVIKPDDPMVYGRDWYVDANNRKIGLRMYDPYEYMVREWAPTHTHNFSVNGKEGRTDYNISLGYLDQEGINKPAKIDDFKRYNGSVRVGTDITDKFRVYTGAMYSKRVKRYPYATNSTTADPWLYLYRWASTYPLTTEDGDPIRSPYSEMQQANTGFQEYNYTNANLGFTYTPLKDWNINFDFTHANQEYITKRPGTRFTARDSWTAALPKFDEGGNRIYVNDAGQVVPDGSAGAMPAYELNMWTYTSVGANPDHVYRYVRNDQRNNLNLNTTYAMNLDDVHKFNFMLGATRTGYEEAYNWSQTTALIDYDNPQFDLATGNQTTSGGEYWESLVGFYGRVNYNFKEKYLLEGNLRYDGTSKFPAALQWRWFPSFSAGWRVSEEEWMDWMTPIVNSLKIRGSWGTIGDQTVSNSLYIPTMGGAMNSWILGGARLYRFATPAAVSGSVTWQDITTLDLGFDARFLSDFGVTFDWFQRDTRNMIVPQEGLPTTYGTGAPQSNFGSLRTTGFELQLDYNKMFKNGFYVNITATLSDAVTKITKYGTTKSIDSWYVGKTYGEIWGYETDRLYQASDFKYDGDGKLVVVTSKDNFQVYELADPNGATQGRLQAGNFMFGPGDVKFVDRNGDGIISPGNRLIEDADGKPDYGDLKIIGNSTPRFLYGLRGDVGYKGFDLSLFFQGVGKRDVWGDGFLAIPGYNSADGAMPQAFAGDFWREDRTDAFYPRPYNQAGSSTTLNMVPQTRYLLNMAYLRLKNITLGYTLPDDLTKRAMLSRARVYVSLENFLTFDHLGTLPIDPEEIQGYSMWNTSNYNLGRTGVGVPTYKTASVGLQLNF